jgi:hypothetical protein
LPGHILAPHFAVLALGLREDRAMKCIVCGEDKSPEIHFDVPVICSECARLQLLQVATQTDPPENTKRHDVD